MFPPVSNFNYPDKWELVALVQYGAIEPVTAGQRIDDNYLHQRNPQLILRKRNFQTSRHRVFIGGDNLEKY